MKGGVVKVAVKDDAIDLIIEEPAKAADHQTKRPRF